MKIKIEEQSLFIDKLNWIKFSIREEGQDKEIWFNPQNVQNVIFDWKENTISIVLNNSDVYEIICNNPFSTIKNLVEEYLIWTYTKI